MIKCLKISTATIVNYFPIISLKRSLPGYAVIKELRLLFAIKNKFWMVGGKLSCTGCRVFQEPWVS
jgi:hypothetical protein